MMHALFEAYLSEVAAHLSALPAKRRDEEMREMRAHLENAVIVNRELGQAEDEAARTAVAQFGAAQDLGRNLVWAWRRGETMNGRSFWGAAVSTPLMLTCLFLLQSHYFGFLLQYLLPPWLNRYCVKHPDIIMAMVQGCFLMTFGLAGFVCGGLFPKRAVCGVSLGLAFFWIGWAVEIGPRVLRPNGDDTAWILTALLAAWAGSRWRQGRRGRTRLA